METEEQRRVRPGDTVRKFANCARERYGHSPRWLWLYLQKDPEAPRPLYIGAAPHMIDREVDADLARWEKSRQAA